MQYRVVLHIFIGQLFETDPLEKDLSSMLRLLGAIGLYKGHHDSCFRVRHRGKGPRSYNCVEMIQWLCWDPIIVCGNDQMVVLGSNHCVWK